MFTGHRPKEKVQFQEQEPRDRGGAVGLWGWREAAPRKWRASEAVQDISISNTEFRACGGSPPPVMAGKG